MKTPIKLPSLTDGMTSEDFEILEAFVSQKGKKRIAPPAEPINPNDPLDPKDAPLREPAKVDAELTYLDLPSHRRATDTTQAFLGFGRSTSTSTQDSLSNLTVGDEILLLRENEIYLSAKTTETHKQPIGSMSGYRMVGNELSLSKDSVVRFAGLRLKTENIQRIENFSYAYRSYASSLFKNLSFSGELGAGVPDIFDFNTSASHKRGVVETDEVIEMHFQASQMIPKARVVFNRAQLSLDDDFVNQVKAACDNDDVIDLLQSLEHGGQFVPLSIVLGGRIVLLWDAVLKDKSEFAAEINELYATAKGQFEYQGMPFSGNAAVGAGTQHQSQQTRTDQTKVLHMEVMGGDIREATSETGVLGTYWIDTVGPFLKWRTIGFDKKSLVPIIEFLPEKKYKDKCKDMLRKHFVAHLSVQFKMAGQAQGQRYERDVKKVKALKSLVVNHDGNVDGLKLNYEVYGVRPPSGGVVYSMNESGTYLTQDKLGNDRGRQYDATVPPFNKDFNPGETILTINTRLDASSDKNGILRQIQLVTNEGNTYPSDTGFFGKNKWLDERAITVLRARGICGYGSDYVRSIGLTYLRLSDNIESRDYMLAMEPYLFPDQDYEVP
jgi:hypothetical protein